VNEPEAGRRCRATGLRLVHAEAGIAFRVAKDRGRGPLVGCQNEYVGPRPPGTGADPCGRFDISRSRRYLRSTPAKYAGFETPFRSQGRGQSTDDPAMRD